MIRTESELRVALHAVLVTVLAFYGFWSCAIVALAVLLPWKPILAAAAYLAQPVMEWLAEAVHQRHENRARNIEGQRQARMAAAEKAARLPALSAADPDDAWEDFRVSQMLKRRDIKKPMSSQSVEPGPQANPEDTMAVLPFIIEHLRNSSHDVLTKMRLEVEHVKFHGETADACVRFQSPNVTELVIRERYLLRKSGERWHVQPRQPAASSEGRSQILGSGRLQS